MIIPFCKRKVDITTPKFYARFVTKYCRKRNLDPQLFAALIYHESDGGNIYAWKYEPGWYRRLMDIPRAKMIGYVPDPPPGLNDEKLQRSCSYGLCQILGQTAREFGFSGEYLMELCDPRINIDLGTRIFEYKYKVAKRKLKDSSILEVTDQALLYYNGGGNKDYPRLVRRHLKNGDFKKILAK